jgi:hypothetical protein
MDNATREYHKVVEKAHKWFSTPGSKEKDHPIKYGGYDRDDIIKANPNAKEVINLNKYVMTIDMQDESCEKEHGYFQRPYVDFMILDTYAKKLVKHLENHPHITFFTGPASHVLRYANVKGRRELSGDDNFFNLTKTDVKNYSEEDKRNPHMFQKEKVKDGYLRNTNAPLNYPDRSSDPQWKTGIPSPLSKYKNRLWDANAVWDKYCEKGSARKMLTILIDALKTIQQSPSDLSSNTESETESDALSDASSNTSDTSDASDSE